MTERWVFVGRFAGNLVWRKEVRRMLWDWECWLPTDEYAWRSGIEFWGLAAEYRRVFAESNARIRALMRESVQKVVEALRAGHVTADDVYVDVHDDLTIGGVS